MNNILAVGAHPDDIEVGCFGSLLKHKQNGDKIHILITTRGQGGNRTWKSIYHELTTSMKILRPDTITILQNRNGYLTMNMKNVSYIDAIIEKANIDSVYTLWYGDSHQDHQETFKIVMAACRKSKVDNIYCCELGNYVFHAHFAFRPQLFVDISDTIDLKLASINCYKSYFNQKDIEDIKSLAKYRGSCCNSSYAEAFEIIRNVRRS
jgi:LmbE family N-acetylglucosaminyl deacetylase